MRMMRESNKRLAMAKLNLLPSFDREVLTPVRMLLSSLFDFSSLFCSIKFVFSPHRVAAN
jgi:hypothetical protein